MIFYDVTLMVGQNSTLEYDKTGGIIEKQLSLNNLNINIAEDKVGKFTVVKDPILNHVNIYVLELYDLPIEVINMFKSNLVTAIVIRMGNSMIENQKNFNLFKIFMKPITLYEHALQEDKVVNDIIIKGISLTANAMILDSSFGAEIEMVDTTSVTSSINTPGSKQNPGYKNYTPMNPNDTLGTTNFNPNDLSVHANIRAKNPGNIRYRSDITWPGQVGYIETINGKFVLFDSYENGAAAGLANLRNYMQTHNKYTIRDIIYRWAPPSDKNDTEGYIRSVSYKTGIDPYKKLSEEDLASLFKVMAQHEGDNKNIYTDGIINRGAQIAGINSVVNSNYKYGNFDSNSYIGGTNINRLINAFENITGFNLLSTFLQKVKEKYNIEVDTKSLANIIKSNFMYKNISLPAVNTLELLKKLHNDYPAYKASVPWILDDAKPTQDINKVGKTYYTEINILAIDSLDYRSLKSIYNNNPNLSVSLMARENFRQFYDETIDRVEAKHIVFKDLTNSTETIFPGKSSNEVAIVPNVESSTTNSEGIKQIRINSGETIIVEAAYDASEFRKRYDLFLNHLKTNPQLVRCIIHSDNPEFIDFGYSYTFSEQQLNKITPYKIKMEFENINNQFRLTYEVDFYKGIGVVQA